MYATVPLELPADMTIEPMDYQLKEAQQLHDLCEGPLHGGLLGNPPGVGKTLTGILVAHLVRHRPNLVVVVCPSAIKNDWLLTATKSWTDVRKRRTWPRFAIY